MLKLLEIWLSPSYEETFEAHLLWGQICMGFFCFMMSVEITTTQGSESPSICFSDIFCGFTLQPNYDQSVSQTLEEQLVW